MFKSTKIGVKLLIAFVVIDFIPFAVIGYFSWAKGRETLEAQVFNQLESIREIKKSRVEQFFLEREKDTHVLLEIVNHAMQNALQKLRSVQEDKKLQLQWYFQERLNDVNTLAKMGFVAQALTQFDGAFHTGARARCGRRSAARAVWQRSCAGRLRPHHAARDPLALRRLRRGLLPAHAAGGTAGR